jgi:hypothetical protein
LDITTTPIGAIARLEHALADFEGKQEKYRRRLAGAQSAAPRTGRVGEAFTFEAELKLKREQLADVEADLASDKDDADNRSGRAADRKAAQAAISTGGSRRRSGSLGPGLHRPISKAPG